MIVRLWNLLEQFLEFSSTSDFEMLKLNLFRLVLAVCLTISCLALSHMGILRLRFLLLLPKRLTTLPLSKFYIF